MTEVFHTYIIQQRRGTVTFVGHKYICFPRTGYQTKPCSLIWQSRLREDTTNSVLEFQIVLRLKRVFTYRNSVLLKRNVCRRTVLMPLLIFHVTWPVIAFTHPLHRHTNISHSIVPSTTYRKSYCANFQSLCIINFFFFFPLDIPIYFWYFVDRVSLPTSCNKPTATVHATHTKTASVVPPEDRRLTLETCRRLRHNKVIVKVKVYFVGYVIVIPIYYLLMA
jgi:hypothetical protein